MLKMVGGATCKWLMLGAWLFDESVRMCCMYCYKTWNEVNIRHLILYRLPKKTRKTSQKWIQKWKQSKRKCNPRWISSNQSKKVCESFYILQYFRFQIAARFRWISQIEYHVWLDRKSGRNIANYSYFKQYSLRTNLIVVFECHRFQ